MQETGSRPREKPPATRELPLLGHLAELRRRVIVSLLVLLVAAAACFAFYEPILGFLLAPLAAANPGGAALYVTTLVEGFLIRIKTSVVAGLVLSLPVHFFNLVGFLLPALTGREKRILITGMSVSFVLAGLSAWYGYTTVVPLTVGFLTRSGFVPEQVGLLLSFGWNLSFVLWFLGITVLLFQFPVILEILLAVNLIKRASLVRSSRYVIVGIFLLAAILTPPDFVSQIMLALPLVALYFLTVLVARIFGFGEEKWD